LLFALRIASAPKATKRAAVQGTAGVSVGPDGRIVIADEVAAGGKRAGGTSAKRPAAEAMDLDAVIEDASRSYVFKGANWDKAAAAGGAVPAKRTKRNVEWAMNRGDDDDDDDDGADAGLASDVASVGTRGTRRTAMSAATSRARSVKSGATARSKKLAGIDLGDRFKAKKARGDIRRAGQPEPFAYLPLGAMATTKRKHAKLEGKERKVVMAALRGSAAGKKARTAAKGAPAGGRHQR